MTFAVDGADAGFILQTYENVTADSDGTLTPIFNNFRSSETASTVVVRKAPSNVVVTSATLIRSSRRGAGGAVSTRQSGNIDRNHELILKPSIKYLIRITNLSTSANNINVDFSWYEEE